MTVEPLRTVRDHLSEFVDRAEREHERVVVTRNGRPAAVLIGYDGLRSLEEALDILSDPEALNEVRQAEAEAEAEVARGEVVRGVDAIKALRPGPIGKPLTRELRGRYAARRGAFRIICTIDDAEHLITVLRVEHRADIYRPR